MIASFKINAPLHLCIERIKIYYNASALLHLKAQPIRTCMHIYRTLRNVVQGTRNVFRFFVRLSKVAMEPP